jgi:hypothetical protein
VAHGVLYIVAENPQKPHIADQVNKSSVKKHAREDAQNRRNYRDICTQVLAPQDYRGDCPVLKDKELGRPGPKRELIQKNRYINRNQSPGDDGGDGGGIIVF